MSYLILKILGSLDKDHVDNQFSKVFREFLQPTTALTLNSAAQLTLDTLSDNAAHSDESCVLAETCVELVEHILYYHKAHLKLAALIYTLQRSAKLMAEPHQTDKLGGYFVRFQRLGGVLLDNISSTDAKNPVTWVSWQAFCAHLYQCRVGPNDPTWAMWAQRDAHEGRGNPGRKTKESPEECAAYVLGAAQWILIFGQSVFQQVQYPGDLTSDDLRCSAPGPFYHDKAHLSLHRWQFWRRGYAAVACEKHEVKGIVLECRLVAAKAVQLMDCLEQCMAF